MLSQPYFKGLINETSETLRPVYCLWREVSWDVGLYVVEVVIEVPTYPQRDPGVELERREVLVYGRRKLGLFMRSMSHWCQEPPSYLLGSDLDRDQF